jgi:hypothetical protein
MGFLKMNNIENKKQMKINYKKMFSKVRAIVNHYDPMGLVPPAPEDEYDYQVNKIMLLLSTTDSLDQVVFGIREIIGDFFGREQDKQSLLFVEMAKELLQVIRDLQKNVNK